MNIIFYSQNGSSEYAQMMIDKNEDFVIREFKFDEVKNYKEVNPGVLIMDAPINKIKDVCMVTKFETSVLIIADEIPSDLTVRADSYDFITRPVNEFELTTRIEALAKTSKYRITLKKQSVTDALTGLHKRK